MSIFDFSVIFRFIVCFCVLRTDESRKVYHRIFGSRVAVPMTNNDIDDIMTRINFLRSLSSPAASKMNCLDWNVNLAKKAVAYAESCDTAPIGNSLDVAFKMDKRKEFYRILEDSWFSELYYVEKKKCKNGEPRNCKNFKAIDCSIHVNEDTLNYFYKENGIMEKRAVCLIFDKRNEIPIACSLRNASRNGGIETPVYNSLWKFRGYQAGRTNETVELMDTQSAHISINSEEELMNAESDFVGCAQAPCPNNEYLYVCVFDKISTDENFVPYEVGAACSKCAEPKALCINATLCCSLRTESLPSTTVTSTNVPITPNQGPVTTTVPTVTERVTTLSSGSKNNSLCYDKLGLECWELRRFLYCTKYEDEMKVYCTKSCDFC